MPYFSTAGARQILGLVLLATPQETVAIFAAECANEFVLLILHRAVTSVMPFQATNQTGDYPIHSVLTISTFYILLV
jgi:hypothetical protein